MNHDIKQGMQLHIFLIVFFDKSFGPDAFGLA